MEESFGSKPNEASELTPAAREIVSSMENQQTRKKSKWAGFGTLIVTLILFAGAGLFNSTIDSIIAVIIILFIHESGHFIAMKLAGYKDVNMFFIPLLGAAVSGKKTDVPARIKVLISAAGPVPGIVLGIVLGLMSQKGDFLYYFALNSIFINAINLLPILPLDGGHIVQSLVFGRNKYLEVGFNVIASAVLLGAAILLQQFILALVALPVLLNITASYKNSLIAQYFKGNSFKGKFTEQDNDVINSVIAITAVKYNNLMNEPRRLYTVENVWERIITKSPRLWETIFMLSGYVLTILISVYFYIQLIR